MTEQTVNLEEVEKLIDFKRRYQRIKCLVIIIFIIQILSVPPLYFLAINNNFKIEDQQIKLDKTTKELKAKDEVILEKEIQIGKLEAKIEDLKIPSKKNNLVIAKYNIQSNVEETKLFDNDYIKLASEDYRIAIDGKLISTNYYKFPSTGTFTVIISFKIPLTSLNHIFAQNDLLTELDLSDLNTNFVTDASFMVYRSHYLTSLNLKNFNTSSVINMESMLEGLFYIKYLDVSSFDTSKVTNMQAMFIELHELTSLDLKNFDTSSVTNMFWMLSCMSEITSLDLSGFTTSSVTIMANMFDATKRIKTLDIRNFEILDETNIEGIFRRIPNSADIKIIVNSKKKQQKIINYLKENCDQWTIEDVGK